MRVGTRVAWLAAPLTLLLAACTATSAAEPGADDQVGPFAGCASLTGALPAAAPGASPGAVPSGPAGSDASPSGPAGSDVGPSGAVSSAVASAGVAGSGASAAAAAPADLPDLELPCFAGGAPVRLVELRGPAVINLWGSWCGPCREELPVMQELADATEGRLRVLGVDTRDERDHGASFAADFGISMPTLYDREQKLLSALGRSTLPLTVFLNEAGEQYVYSGRALDKPALGELVRTRTGVTVTG